MTGAAFDQIVCLAFLDDGVFQLKRGQSPQVIGMKHYSRAFGALGDFEVTSVFVELESLKTRGLNQSDLIEINDEDDKNMVKVIPTIELATVMNEQDIVLQV